MAYRLSVTRKKEPQGSHGMIEDRYLGAVLGQLQLKVPYLLEACLFGGSADECCQMFDRADVVVLRLVR